MMIHLALDALPDWSAGAALKEFAYVHVAPDLAMMSRVYSEASVGLLPAEPALVVGQPTAIDPSRAPQGKHILWVQVRVLPAEIRGDASGEIASTTWDDAKEAYAERVLDILETYAPGLRRLVLARSVWSPLDLERENPCLIGGDNLSGSHHLDQNFFLRPVAGYSRYATPVKRPLSLRRLDLARRGNRRRLRFYAREDAGGMSKSNVRTGRQRKGDDMRIVCIGGGPAGLYFGLLHEEAPKSGAHQSPWSSATSLTTPSAGALYSRTR